jgi:hypothetical protein
MINRYPRIAGSQSEAFFISVRLRLFNEPIKRITFFKRYQKSQEKEDTGNHQLQLLSFQSFRGTVSFTICSSPAMIVGCNISGFSQKII